MLFLLFLSCKESPKEKDTLGNSVASEISQSSAAITVSMEGTTHMLPQKELNPVTTTFETDTLQFVFYTNDNPLQINLNLTNTNILEKGAATYTIPDVNHQKVKVDLNFFNNNRDVKRMNKRIIFRKGIIDITKITENELQMTFEGEGSGMMESGQNFPIRGEAKVKF